jgi:hypothetical protein
MQLAWPPLDEKTLSPGLMLLTALPTAFFAVVVPCAAVAESTPPPAAAALVIPPLEIPE